MKFVVFVVCVFVLAIILSYGNWEFQKKVDSVLAKSSPDLLDVRWDVEGEPYDVPCFVDNVDAKDCTYEDLLVFLKEDQTDRMIVQIDDVLSRCERYALVLHDNAEKEGIRCGFTVITFAEIDEEYGRFGHALCAFYTLDKGLIFIDDTRSDRDVVSSDNWKNVLPDDHFDVNFDKIGEVAVGNKYMPRRLFNSMNYKEMGTVESVDIYWEELDGE